MRKRIVALLFLALLVPTGMAWAESPIACSHTMTNYTMNADSVTLTYMLTVRNTGPSAITNLTLTLVPLTIITSDKIALNIANLAPQAQQQVSFTVNPPMKLEQTQLSGQPLFWAGTCVDSKGNALEFPARSSNGGAI